MSDPTLFINCSECKKRFNLDNTNSILHLYQRSMYCCYLESECPYCGEVFRNFAEEDVVRLAIEIGLTVAPHDTAPLGLIEEWCRLQGYEMIEAKELTPRLEELATSMARLLHQLPDEWLMELFSSPPPKTDLPKEWS